MLNNIFKECFWIFTSWHGLGRVLVVMFLSLLKAVLYETLQTFFDDFMSKLVTVN